MPGASGWVSPTVEIGATSDSPPTAAASHFDAEISSRPNFDPDVPRQVGRYHILKPIGEGGMGAVYLAEQREPIKRQVALKLIRGQFASRQMLVRFDSERQALARMDHANVAKVLDAGSTESGQPYFVMEYVAGKPIDEYADDKRLDLKARLGLFLQACAAIAHAHAKAMIHRDIKAGNVLAYDNAAGEPAVKVIDFGIAKALGDEKLVEATATIGPGSVVGTPFAMSPEQADGDVDIDTRTDVYALGVLLYELLAGRKPLELQDFTGLTLTKQLDLVRSKEPPRPSAWLSGLPAAQAEAIADARSTKPSALVRDLRRELEWIPLKALRKERERRYASVEQLAADVENYLASRPLTAGPESNVYRTKKLIRRNRIGVATAALIAIASTAGAGYYTVSMRDEQARTEIQLRVADEEAAFFSRAFFEASPYVGNANATLSDGINAAVADLKARDPFADRPDLRANLEMRFGDTLRARGYFVKADELLSSAVSRLEHLPNSEATLAKSLQLLGSTQVRENHLDAAKTSLNRAISIEHDRPDNDKENLAEATLNLGVAEFEANELVTAEKAFEDAMALFERIPGNHQGSISRCLQNMGGIAERENRADEAVKLYQQSLERGTRASGEDVMRAAQVHNNLGNIYAKQHKFEDAVVQLRDALQLFENRGADTAQDGLKTISSLASAYRNAGDLAQAEINSRRAIAGMLKRDEMASDLANARSGLGRTLLATPGREAEAEPYLRDAFDYRIAHHSDGLELTAAALIQTYVRLNKPEQAAVVKSRMDAVSTTQPKGPDFRAR